MKQVIETNQDAEGGIYALPHGVAFHPYPRNATVKQAPGKYKLSGVALAHSPARPLDMGLDFVALESLCAERFVKARRVAIGLIGFDGGLIGRGVGPVFVERVGVIERSADLLTATAFSPCCVPKWVFGTS